MVMSKGRAACTPESTLSSTVLLMLGGMELQLAQNPAGTWNAPSIIWEPIRSLLSSSLVCVDLGHGKKPKRSPALIDSAFSTRRRCRPSGSCPAVVLN